MWWEKSIYWVLKNHQKAFLTLYLKKVHFNCSIYENHFMTAKVF